MRRVNRAVLVLILAALCFGMPAAIATNPPTPLPPPTSTAPPARWVVESGSTSRSNGNVTYKVTCVPEGDLGKPYEDRTVWRVLAVPAEVSYSAEEGQPCPDGTLLEELR